MSLTEQMIECVEAASVNVNDYDQRSAIGMARTWVDRREPIKWKVEQIHVPNRDKLAEDLVALMEGVDDRDEMIEALQGVRAHVNAPFVDPSMLGWRASRREMLKPRDVKKARESAK